MGTSKGLPFPSPSQDKKVELERLIYYTVELEFQLALEKYVQELFVDYGIDEIPQEYFLIGLMRLVNQEVSRRLDNPKKARNAYLADLEQMLEEIGVLKYRLGNSGINDLNRFVSELENHITYTVNSKEINFKKKKIFEDALQMLYIAEEMIKLDQLQQSTQTTEFNQKLIRSKQQLLTAFGEVSTSSGNVSGVRHSIYDLFSEWKKLDQTKYGLRIADVKLARQNLLKTSGIEEIMRMFNEELKLAYNAFNNEYYDFAERLLGDVIETYPIYGLKNIDDVYFYHGEANFALGRLFHAEELYTELLRLYPATSYLPDVYGRLTSIYFSVNDYPKTLEFGVQYENVASPSSSYYYDVQYMMAMANFLQGNYSNAVQQFSNIPRNHPYNNFAVYFRANANVENMNYDQAIVDYLDLINRKKILPSLQNRAYYKLGILEFERKNYFAALEYLSQIPENIPRYDKILNALAWAHYEYDRTKSQDEWLGFYYAKLYAQKVLSEYYASPYRMEASSLLAYINQLESNPSDALNLYKDAYNMKVNKLSADEYLIERKKLNDLYYTTEVLKNEALEKGDPEQYLRAHDLMEKLEKQIIELDLAEASVVGIQAYSEVDAVFSQLEELKRLRYLALSRTDFETVARIDTVTINLASALDKFPTEALNRTNYVNLFDEYPASKLVAEQESISEGFQGNRQEIRKEIGHIDTEILELEGDIGRYKNSNNYGAVAELEQEHRKLLELRKSYDELLSSIYLMDDSPESYTELNKWGDFGAFGIINVQFFQQQQIQNQMKDLSLSLNKVNEDITQRKQVIEDKVKKIEAEIRLMTMKARVEERTRQRAERERRFRESYFDTRTSEQEEE
jgi:TolA-binding protein